MCKICRWVKVKTELVGHLARLDKIIKEAIASVEASCFQHVHHSDTLWHIRNKFNVPLSSDGSVLCLKDPFKRWNNAETHLSMPLESAEAYLATLTKLNYGIIYDVIVSAL